MPTSQNYQISKILNLIIASNPASVLDIGVGFGKYGVLCREYLELWDGREEYADFTRKIDGIEAFEKYLTPLHEFIYNKIYIGNATELVDKLENSYDLVLLIDVLEHFEKNQGRELLEKLLQKNGAVLVSVPKNIGNQKDAFANAYETHVAEWSKRDFKKLAKTFFVQDYESRIVYLGKAPQIDRLRKEYFLRKMKHIAKSVPYASQAYQYIKKYRKKS